MRQGVVKLHSIAANVPVMLRHHVLQVDVVVAQSAFRIQHGRHHRQAALVSRIKHHEPRLARMAHRPEAIAQESGIRHHVFARLAIAG